jgi:hypothetical protein
LTASPERLRRAASLLAVGAVAFAAAYPMQVNGFNQNAHYALVRALADGTTTVDKTRHQIGDLSTNDVQLYKGHYYSNKAPGLPFLTLPAFEVVKATGYRTSGDPTKPIWPLHVWSIVLPFFVLLLLLCDRGDRIQRGLGTAAALTVGLGTLALPFATMFFSHVLSASLGFVAFFLLWHEREGPRRLRLVAAGGLAAGLAVTTEYSLVFVAAVCGVYALVRGDYVRRALAYLGGVAAGVLPLAFYNLWSFGSITHLSYENNQTGVNDKVRNFALMWPSAHQLSDILFSAWGLLTLTPVLACGAVGAVLLYRRGMRAEALVCLAIPAIFLLWGASLGNGVSPFGGLGPPRYQIPMIPFLVLPVAVAFRAFPATTVALGLVSAFQMVVQTGTNPLAAYDGAWMTRVRTEQFSQTAASLLGVTGWYTIVLFFLAVLVALALGAFVTGRFRVPTWELALAPAALLVWALVALDARNPAGRKFGPAYIAALALVACACALVASLNRPPLRLRVR